MFENISPNILALLTIIGSFIAGMSGTWVMNKRVSSQNKKDESGAGKDQAETIEVISRVTKERIEEAVSDAHEAKEEATKSAQMYLVLLNRTEGMVRMTTTWQQRELLEHGRTQAISIIEIVKV